MPPGTNNKPFEFSLAHRINSGSIDSSRPAPIINQSLFPAILDALGSVMPTNVPINRWGKILVHGQGQPAPDTGPLPSKDWESNPQTSQPSIFDQLLGLALGGQADTGAIQSAAQAAANAEYDPQIAELKRMMGIAQQRADTGRAQIGNMYDLLSKSDVADIGSIDKMFGGAVNDVNSQYAKMQGQTDQAYQQAQQEQMDLMKRLNIQAAAPNALKGQQADQALLTGQNAESKQSMLDSMKLLQTGADNFSRQGGEIARFEGTNRQADLMSQLQDYLSQSEGKIGDLNLAKQNAYQVALGQQQQSYRQQQNDMFSHLLEIAKLQQAQQQLQGAAATQYRQGPLAASQYLGTNSDQPTLLNSFLLQTLQQQPFTGGQMPGPNGTMSRLTPEAAAQIASSQAADAGFSPENQQAIYLATLAYYGRMY